MPVNAAGGHVLVVDDDADFCRFVVQLLRSAAFRARAAPDGRKALGAARLLRPAVVLLDVNLPDISGYEVCHRLRREFGSDVSIFFVSGERTEDYDREAGLLLGADDYITKPFDPDELIARVRREVGLFNGGPASGADLTERERDVLKLLSEGLGEKRIAERLFISPKTVATHIQHILPKLGVHSRAEAVAFAHCQRLFGGS
jgi:two-component system OmpR family response regulator